mgnify:CR=1 FL=1
MAKIRQNIIIILLLSSFGVYAQKLVLGAERIDKILKTIDNKNIAIVGNQTSVVNQVHLVDTLISLNQKIISVFSPEHGFRGVEDAGAKVDNEIDKKTGLPIISLYGKNKKPTSEQLIGIDIIIFDIQDVGARFYTYISTLHYILEACSEKNIKVVILDRPNPNGHYVDGPILEEKYKSFVGMHQIPIVHGMTIGEYATMIVGEKWIENNCNLEIIEMINYNRNNNYELPIKPSPNLPNSKSINLYPSLCLFEGTNVSVGRGTDKPFQHFGSPFLKFYSYAFQPKSGPGSKYPKHENKTCVGKNLENYPYLSSINLNWLIESYNQTNNKEDFFNSFFDKLAGTDKLRTQIISGLNEKEIRSSWKTGLKEFKKTRTKYLLY